MISGWITDEIDNLCNVEYGTRVVQKNDGGTIYPVYGGGGATFFMDTYNREDRLTIARFAMSAKCTRFVKGKFFLNDSGLTLSPKNKSQIEQDFLNYQCLALNDVFYSLAKGSAQKNLDVPAFRKLKLNIPTDINLQRKIVAKLDAIFAEIDKATATAEANAENAEALFQSYMSKTFAECESLYSLSQLITICDLQNGYAFKSADYIEYSETLNIRMSSIRPGGFFDAEHNKRYLPDSYAEKYKEFLLKEGDLVIAMTDMAGDPKILGVPTIVKNLNGRRFLMNQRVGKLHKFSDSIHIPYLRYFLTSPKIKEFYKNKGDGGLQINISKKDILSAEIPLPPLSIQEKIGKEMTYVQSHSEISKNRYYKKINEYIALKQSILKQAFTGELVKE